MRAGEAATWDNLHERFEIKGINHQAAHRLDGAGADMAAKCFSRLCRAEVGIHQHVAGPHLLRDAQEIPWREQAKRSPVLKPAHR